MKPIRWWHGRRRHWEAGLKVGYRLGREAVLRELMSHLTRPPGP